MTDKLTMADFPEGATYTRWGDAAYCYIKNKCVWASVLSGLKIALANPVRYASEVDITRDEAIAIVRERGQLADEPALAPSLTDRLAATKYRLMEACDYEGACAVRDAMEKLTPVEPAPSIPTSRYGGPHDDAADAWAKERGYRVVGWRSPNRGEAYIPSIPGGWGSAPTEAYQDWLMTRAYIVEPLPVAPLPKADAPAEPTDAAKWVPKVGERVQHNLGTGSFLAIEGDEAWVKSDGGTGCWTISTIHQGMKPLSPAPTVKRRNESVTFDVGNTHETLPFVNEGKGWRVDREKIGAEWAVEWLENNGYATLIPAVIGTLKSIAEATP